MNMVEYALYTHDSWPQLSNGKLYRYILAANGAFVYAKNDYFEACVRITSLIQGEKMIRGLLPVTPFFGFKHKIDVSLFREMEEDAIRCLPMESLYRFKFEPDMIWKLIKPAARVSLSSLSPAEMYPDYCPVEIHSHGYAPAFFSAVDNADETGLRVYGVIGKVGQIGEAITMRVSIYGHWAIIPWRSVFSYEMEKK